MVKELTDDSLDEFVTKHDIVVLDVFTTWCGPCVMQAQILEEFSNDVDKKLVAIAKIDADQSPKTCQRFQIRAIPTLVLFKNGKPVKTHVGVWPKDELKKEVQALM